MVVAQSTIKILVLESSVRGDSDATTVAEAANSGNPLVSFPQDKPAICARPSPAQVTECCLVKEM